MRSSTPRVKVFNHRAKDAPRNTLVGENPNEERDGRALIDEAMKTARSFKDEAYEIAGNFRGPGLWSRVKSALRSVD